MRSRAVHGKSVLNSIITQKMDDGWITADRSKLLFIFVADLSQPKDVHYKKRIDGALCHDQSPLG